VFYIYMEHMQEWFKRRRTAKVAPEPVHAAAAK